MYFLGILIQARFRQIIKQSKLYIYLFIYTTCIKRSIHKQTCSNALFNKYIYTVVSIVDIILLIIEVYYISRCVRISRF